jgi:hypothetical protein
MEPLFDGITITDFHDDAHRNIVSLRESENLFDDLTDSPGGWQSAIDLEAGTKPHTNISHQPVIDRPFEEAAYNEAIDYPFKHWSTTRYSDGTFGVWYGADSLETGIHETVYHWRYGLLQDAGWEDHEGVTIERKVYNVRCDAALLNFRPKLAAFPSLVDPQDVAFTHQIGTRIHHDGHPGLVSRSARCDGDVYAIFNAQVLSNPRQMCFLTYRIASGAVIIERHPDPLTPYPYQREKKKAGV